MADGSVSVIVDMDDKSAQKKLNDLRKNIEKTARAIDTSTSKRSAIETQLDSARQAAQGLQKELDEINARRREVNATLEGTNDNSSGGAAVDPVAWMAAKEEAEELDARAAELAPKITAAQKEVAKLEKDEEKVTAQIDEQTQKLDAMTEEYGATERAAQSAAHGLNISQSVQQATASIKQGAKNLLKWGFGIRSVLILMRKLRNAIKEGVSEFAKADPATKAALDGIKKSLTGLKASFGAAFAPLLQAIAPILQKLIGWLTQAANAVQQFFAVLSGKGTYKRVINANNALAESYSAAGGAAKDAQKQLLGFDEINQISDQSSGGGGGGGSDAAKVEWEETELDSWTDKLKEGLLWVQEHLQLIKTLALAVGAAFAAIKIAKLVAGIGRISKLLIPIAGAVLLVAGAFDAWTNGINWDNFVEMLGGVSLLAGGLALKFGKTGAVIGLLVGGIGMLVVGFKEWITTGELSGATFATIAAGLTAIGVAISLLTMNWIPLLIAAVAIVIVAIVGYWDEIVKFLSETWAKIKNTALDIFEKIGEFFNEVWDGILTAATTAWEYVKGFLIAAWEEISKAATTVWEYVKEFLIAAWDEICAAATAAFEPIAKFFMELWTSVAKTTASIWNAIISVFVSVWSSIREIFEGIINFVSGVFTGDWERAWNGIVQIFSGIWEGITGVMKGILNVGIGIVEGFINFVISGVNAILSGISSVVSAVGSVLGFGDVSLSLGYVTLPRLAKGGIVDSATAFIAGEAGKEAVIPLERNTEWIKTVADGLLDNITNGDRLADYITGRALPAVVTGQLVPPRAASGGGGILGDGDVEKLVSGLVRALGESGSGDDNVTRIYLDGKVITEVVTKRQKGAAYAYGV